MKKIRISSSGMRGLFILGYFLLIVTMFVPYQRLDTGNGVRLISPFGEARFFQQDDPSYFRFMIVLISIFFVFLLLSLFYAKQWVFILGATIAALFFVVTTFEVPPFGESFPVIQFIVQRIGAVLALSGFFVRPAKKS